MALVPFGSRKSGPGPRIPRVGRMPKRMSGKGRTSQPGEAAGNPRAADTGSQPGMDAWDMYPDKFTGPVPGDPSRSRP
jgi:hypothetical protein